VRTGSDRGGNAFLSNTEGGRVKGGGWVDDECTIKVRRGAWVSTGGSRQKSVIILSRVRGTDEDLRAPKRG